MSDALVMTQGCLGPVSAALPGGLVGGVKENSARKDSGKSGGRIRWASGKGGGKEEGWGSE